MRLRNSTLFLVNDFYTYFVISEKRYSTNIPCFPKQLEDLLKMSSGKPFFIFQEVFKAFSRRLQDVFLRRFPKTSSKN